MKQQVYNTLPKLDVSTPGKNDGSLQDDPILFFGEQIFRGELKNFRAIVLGGGFKDLPVLPLLTWGNDPII